MTSATPRILLLDHDAIWCETVVEYLTMRGLIVDAGGDFTKALSGNYALLILNVLLCGTDGFDVLRRLRAQEGCSRLPVIMLTDQGDETDRIVALELGADDCLSKPFSERELLARIHAVLRRACYPPEQATSAGHLPAASSLMGLPPLRFADLELNVAARSVHRNGELVLLTSAEFDLLHVLLRSPCCVVTRDELARAVLGRELMPLDRSLDMHISNLRHKLWGECGLQRLQTVRGVGYMLAADLSP